MKLEVLFIVLISLLVLGIQGCEQAEISERGISMAFVENAPPALVATDQAISIYVDIANKGDSNINSGEAKFYLVGIGENIDNVKTRLTNTKLLEKDSMQRLKFAEWAKSGIQVKDQPFPFTISLKACYPYDTETNAKICVADQSNQICSLEGEKITSTSNSAGPIQITSITEKVEAKKLTIEAIVENKGVSESSLGKVYLRNVNCDILQEGDTNPKYRDELLKDKNIDIEVKADGFTCNLEEGTKGTISLTDNKGKITCERRIVNEQTEMLFTIISRYKYQDYISTTITLVKP